MDLTHYRLDDLDDSEVAALQSYKTASDNDQGHSNCFDLNRQLEHGLHLSDMGQLGNLVLTLDGIFDRCPRLQEPLTVFRGTAFRQHMPVLEPKARFRNLSFWSTTLIHDTTFNFLKTPFDNSFGAILTLKLPAGLPCYNMETLIGTGGHEAEILLPRGVLWTVAATSLFTPGALPMHVTNRFANIADVTLEAKLN